MNDTTNIRQDYLQTAVNISRHLQKECFRFDGRCNWQGSALETINNRFQLVHRTFDADLYNGLSGIGLFFAELYCRQPDPLLLETLEETVNNIIYLLTQENELTTLSVYSGRLGVAFSLWKIGGLLDRDDWQAQGMALLAQLEAAPIPDDEVDFIGGAAGAIAALLKIYQQQDDSRWLAFAIRLGEFLVNKATKTETAWSWVQLGFSAGLTGFSHGSGGIGLALLELSVVSGEQHFKQGAYAAFNYEREHFSAKFNNWPDLRSTGTAPQYPVMWCHGAPGVGLSRLRAYELTGDESFLAEARIALGTTYQSLLQELSHQQERLNFSLCHGGPGNAEILLMGAEPLQEPEYVRLVHQLADFGIQQFDQTGILWPSGVHDPSGQTHGKEATPGLMLGMAGTGLFYLQLAYPSEIDSVLYIR